MCVGGGGGGGGGGDMVDAHFKTLSNNLDPVKSNL